MSYPSDTAVLVAVVASQADWERIHQEHWYRIPINHAPQRIGATLMAWCPTRACGDERGQVRWYAPIERVRLATRVQLFPNEPDHPRAHQHYWRIEVGDLKTLPRPILARRQRRMTFIPTRWERLLQATDVADLWLGDYAIEELCQALAEAGYSPTRRRLREGSTPVQHGLEVRPTLDGVLVRWSTGAIRLAFYELIWNLAGCVRRILFHLQRPVNETMAKILLQ
jgi:hypothetical protein